MSGRVVRMVVAIGFLFSSFSPANNQAAGSRSAPVLLLPPLPQAHGDGSEVEGLSRVGGGSYAGTSQPIPWRHVASAVVAPTTSSPSFSNIFVALLRDSPLLDFDLGDSSLEISICCCLMRIYLKMQQPQIVEFMCLPNFASRGSCGLSILAFAERVAFMVVISSEDTLELLRSSCTTRLSIGRRPTCMIQEVSLMLQVMNLHTRNWGAAPIPCFSDQLAAALRDARRHGADVFDPNLTVGWGAFLWGDCWYDMHNLYHVLLLLEISELCFRHVIIAAQYWKCQFWNRLLSVNLWSQANITAVALLYNFVHTQQSFKGSKNHQLCSHTTKGIHGQKRSWNCLCTGKTINGGNAIGVQDRFLMSSKGTMFYLSDDHFVEDAVLPPFGLCHQRWTTTPLSLIPRFNGGDPLRLSSVMVQQNLQLNPPKPRVHTPDRPSGEPPAGHQLVWSTMEALEDCRCSNIESGLSTDERSLFGFIGNLWYQLQVFRSSFFLRLSTFDPSSTLCCRDMLYSEL